MGAVAYVNGSYRALRDATVNVEDRGYQFGDGIYEVVFVHQGRLIDAERHLSRLARSLERIGLTLDRTPQAWRIIIAEVLRRNRITTGLVYIQVTRGVAPRDHAFPVNARPAVVITARHKPAPPRDLDAWAVAAICLPDDRWAHCDIKSINLLPNVLAKQKARAAGAFEAILYDADGMVTEGASSSVWIVDAAGRLTTRPFDRQVLPGCTRAALSEALGTELREAAFSLDELRAAREVFITSATSFVKPVVRLDGAMVGDGKAGPVARRLMGIYWEGKGREGKGREGKGRQALLF
jgi:D-alanine transaminase